MANSEDVVWVDVLPSLSGFVTSLKSGLGAALGVARSSGSEAGAAYGAGFSERAAAAAEAASAKVVTANKRAADAAGALTVAQARLKDITDKGITSGGQYAAAYERVEKAQRNVNVTTEALTRAQSAETAAKKAARDATDSQTVSLSANNEETKKGPGLIKQFSDGWIKAAAVLGTVTYAAYGIKQAFGALYSTIDVASGLNEEINKSRVVFGDASQSVIDFSQNAAKGMGESRLEALQSAGTFGNLFRAVGLTSDQSAVMSTKLVQLASDLASFNNADPSEVLLAMRAGLVGESEPMRKFGVDLSDLALRQEALKLGIYDGTGVLNQAQKAQAAYSLLLKQTTLAQGDFIRTSNGLANSQRILSAEWTDLKGAVGGLLIGPATGVVHWLNDLLPRISTSIDGLHQFGQAFRTGFAEADGAVKSTGLAGVFEFLGQQVRTTVDFLKSLGDMLLGAVRSGLQTAAPLLNGLGGAFSNLVPLIQVVGSHWHELITDVVQAFLPVIRELIPLLAQIAAAFAQVLGQALQAVIPILSVVADTIGQVAQIVAQTLVGVLHDLAPLLPVLAQAFGDLANALGRSLLAVVKELQPILPVLAQAFGDIARVLADSLVGVFQALAPVLPVLAKAFGDIAQSLAGALASALGAIAPVLPGIAKAFGDIAQVVAGALADAIKTIAPVLPPLVDVFVRLLQSAIQPLLPVIPVLAKVFGDIVGAIAPLIPVAAGLVATLGGLASSVLPALAPVLHAVAVTVQALATAFEALPGPVQAIVGAFVLIKATLGVNIFQAAVSAVGGLGSAFTSTMSRITGVVGGAVTAVKGELGSMTAAFAAAKAAQQELVASNFGLGANAVPKAVGDLKGLEAAAGSVASRGFNVLKNAGTGLVSFLGGPWGVAMLGAGAALFGIIQVFADATKKGDDWAKALREGGQAAVDAAAELHQAQKAVEESNTAWGKNKQILNSIFNPTANLAIQAQKRSVDEAAQAQKEYAANATQVQLAQDAVTKAENDLALALKRHGAGSDEATAAGQRLASAERDLKSAQDEVKQATDNATHSLDPLAQAQQRVDDAQKQLNDAIARYGPQSDQARTASGLLAQAQDALKQKQQDVKTATDGATVSLQNQLNTQLGMANASLGLKSSLDSATSTIHQYQADLAAGTLTADQRATAENGVASAILSSVDAAGRAAAQALGPSASAADQAVASAGAQKAAFEKLVGQLGYIPPSLQGVAQSLGVTDQSMKDSQGVIDPTAQKWLDLALGTIQGQVAPTFQKNLPDAIGGSNAALTGQSGSGGPLDANQQAWLNYITGGIWSQFQGLMGALGAIPASIGSTNSALDTQRLNYLPGNAQAWQDYVNSGSWSTFGGLFGIGGVVPGAIDTTNGYLGGQSGPLDQNLQKWHDFVNNPTFGGLLGLFGAGGSVPAAIQGTNGYLGSQSGPLDQNLQAWYNFVHHPNFSNLLGLFGAGGTVPNAISGTNQALQGQAAPGGPLDQNSKAWQNYLQQLQGFGSQYDQATGQWNAATISYQTQTQTSLGIINAAFGATDTTVQGKLGEIEAHIYGPTTTALNALSSNASANTGVINAAFTGMQQTTTARMVDVENHIYGPMTAALGTFNLNTAANNNAINASFTAMRDWTTARMTDVENHIYGPMTSALGQFSGRVGTNNAVIDASYTAMQQTTTAQMTGVENHIYGPMSSALSALSNRTGTMTQSVAGNFGLMGASIVQTSTAAALGVSNAFARIRSGVGNPVNFVIQNALANGLVRAFNSIAGAIGIGGISVALTPVALAEGGQVPGYADGGQIRGPYIGPKADNVPGYIAFSNGGTAPVRLNPREFIQPVAAVDQYGVGFMEAVRTGAFPTELARGYANGGQIPGFATGGMTYPALEAWVAANLPGSVITSAYRPGANDYHGMGDAVDISYPGNPQSKNMPAAAKIANSFGGITELIHNPNESIKNGVIVPPSFWGAATWAAHANHVHWAMTPAALANAGNVAPAGGPVGIMVNGQLVTSAAQVQQMLNGGIVNPLKVLGDQFGGNQLTYFLMNYTSALANKVWSALEGHITSAIAASAAASTAAAVGGSGVPSGIVQQQVANVFATRGWGSGSPWNATSQIVSHESGWNPTAQNPSSTASGLFQEIDATWAAYRRPQAAGYPKMRLAPINEQAYGGMNYIAGRYGTPEAAWAFWQAHHFYDQGGILGDGMSGSNASGFDERVLSPRQTVAFERLVNVLDRNGGHHPDFAARGPLIGNVELTVRDNDTAYTALDELEHRLQIADLGGRYAWVSRP